MVHRAADSRLLSNLLSHEKDYAKQLQALLSSSSSALSSFAAYAAASPPPASHTILAVAGVLAAADNALHVYAQAVDDWRDMLNGLQVLEDDVGNVIRDREILVTRLIKASKSTKSSISTSNLLSSASNRFSSVSPSSSLLNVSQSFQHLGSPPRSIPTSSKLAAAQSELQACETHLAAKERELEARRFQVVRDGLTIRARAMAEAGRTWTELGREAIVVIENGLGFGDASTKPSSTQHGSENSSFSGPTTNVHPANSATTSISEHPDPAPRSFSPTKQTGNTSPGFFSSLDQDQPPIRHTHSSSSTSNHGETTTGLQIPAAHAISSEIDMPIPIMLFGATPTSPRSSVLSNTPTQGGRDNRSSITMSGTTSTYVSQSTPTARQAHSSSFGQDGPQSNSRPTSDAGPVPPMQYPLFVQDYGSSDPGEYNRSNKYHDMPIANPLGGARSEGRYATSDKPLPAQRESWVSQSDGDEDNWVDAGDGGEEFGFGGGDPVLPSPNPGDRGQSHHQHHDPHAEHSHATSQALSSSSPLAASDPPPADPPASEDPPASQDPPDTSEVGVSVDPSSAQGGQLPPPPVEGPPYFVHAPGSIFDSEEYRKQREEAVRREQERERQMPVQTQRHPTTSASVAGSAAQQQAAQGQARSLAPQTQADRASTASKVPSSCSVSDESAAAALIYERRPGETVYTYAVAPPSASGAGVAGREGEEKEKLAEPTPTTTGVGLPPPLGGLPSVSKETTMPSTAPAIPSFPSSLPTFGEQPEPLASPTYPFGPSAVGTGILSATVAASTVAPSFIPSQGGYAGEQHVLPRKITEEDLGAEQRARVAAEAPPKRVLSEWERGETSSLSEQEEDRLVQEGVLRVVENPRFSAAGGGGGVQPQPQPQGLQREQQGQQPRSQFASIPTATSTTATTTSPLPQAGFGQKMRAALKSPLAGPMTAQGTAEVPQEGAPTAPVAETTTVEAAPVEVVGTPADAIASTVQAEPTPQAAEVEGAQGVAEAPIQMPTPSIPPPVPEETKTPSKRAPAEEHPQRSGGVFGRLFGRGRPVSVSETGGAQARGQAQEVQHPPEPPIAVASTTGEEAIAPSRRAEEYPRQEEEALAPREEAPAPAPAEGLPPAEQPLPAAVEVQAVPPPPLPLPTTTTTTAVEGGTPPRRLKSKKEAKTKEKEPSPSKSGFLGGLRGFFVADLVTDEKVGPSPKKRGLAGGAPPSGGVGGGAGEEQVYYWDQYPYGRGDEDTGGEGGAAVAPATTTTPTKVKKSGHQRSPSKAGGLAALFGRREHQRASSADQLGYYSTPTTLPSAQPQYIIVDNRLDLRKEHPTEALKAKTPSRVERRQLVHRREEVPRPVSALVSPPPATDIGLLSVHAPEPLNIEEMHAQERQAAARTKGWATRTDRNLRELQAESAVGATREMIVVPGGAQFRQPLFEPIVLSDEEVPLRGAAGVRRARTHGAAAAPPAGDVFTDTETTHAARVAPTSTGHPAEQMRRYASGGPGPVPALSAPPARSQSLKVGAASPGRKLKKPRTVAGGGAGRGKGETPVGSPKLETPTLPPPRQVSKRRSSSLPPVLSAPAEAAPLAREVAGGGEVSELKGPVMGVERKRPLAAPKRSSSLSVPPSQVSQNQFGATVLTAGGEHPSGNLARGGWAGAAGANLSRNSSVLSSASAPAGPAKGKAQSSLGQGMGIGRRSTTHARPLSANVTPVAGTRAAKVDKKAGMPLHVPGVPGAVTGAAPIPVPRAPPPTSQHPSLLSIVEDVSRNNRQTEEQLRVLRSGTGLDVAVPQAPLRVYRSELESQVPKAPTPVAPFRGSSFAHRGNPSSRHPSTSSRPAQSPLKSALRQPSRTPSPLSSGLPASSLPVTQSSKMSSPHSTSAASRPLPAKSQGKSSAVADERGMAVDDVDDGASVSSYETADIYTAEEGGTRRGRKVSLQRKDASDAPMKLPRTDATERKAPAPPPVSPPFTNGSINTLPTNNLPAADVPQRKKSVRVSLQPTFSEAPPAMDDEGDRFQRWQMDETPTKPSRHVSNASTLGQSKICKPVNDIWQDSSDEDEGYQKAKLMLSRATVEEQKVFSGR